MDLWSAEWSGADYPAPMGYEQRVELARRLEKRSASLYSGAAFPATAAALRDPLVRKLAELLDDGWAIFHHVRLPDAGETIDTALVGPGGLYVLEQESYSGGWRFEQGFWHRQAADGEWEAEPTVPGARARQDAARLGRYLDARGLDAVSGVTAVVVLPPEHPPEPVPPGTELWWMNALESRVEAASRREVLSAFRVNRIVAVLEQELIEQAALESA